MTDAADQPSDALAQRLAKLSPQQRELLLRQLAQRAPAKANAAVAATIPRAPAGVPLPLSPAQQRMWFFERLQPGTGTYSVYAHYRLRGALDAGALERAFAEVVRRHDALRAGFAESAGTPRQTVAASVPFALARVDLASTPPAARDAALMRLADVETSRPFALGQAPLLRVTLVRLAPDDHALLTVLHHIVSDAWSRGVLFAEVAALYNAFVTGQASPLPELALQYPDVLQWQAQPAQLARATAQLSFWQDALADTTGVLELPVDRPRRAQNANRGGRHSLSLPQPLVSGITEFARREHATPFMALLAAFQVLLAKLSGQDDIVVGSPIANRSRPEFEPLIGLFVNTLALRGDLSGDPTFRALLARTRTHVLAALEHGDAPLEKVIDGLRLERVPGRTPLFQVMFVLQNAGEGGLGLRGLDADWLEPNVDTARFELTLSMGFNAGALLGVLDYDADLFDAATAARIAEQYETLLRQIVADPDRALSRYTLVGPRERGALLALGDGGPAIRPGLDTLHGLVVAQAARTPEAIALVEPARDWRYDEVVRLAQGIAHALHAHGVRPRDRVALLADRSAEAIVGLLGILMAGAAYVPLDPSHPVARLQLLRDDAQVRAVVAPLARRDGADAIATAEVPAVLVGATSPSTDAPRDAITPDDAAYVIYTSGSTGQPKGVVVPHRGAANLTHGFLARHDFTRQRLLMIPPLVFDASVGDLFPALACGAALVLHPSPAELGPFDLERYCDEKRVTGIDAPASLWRRWAEGWASAKRSGPLLPTLRMMMVGGESVPIDTVRRFAAITEGRVELTNHYGPTEASVCATIHATRDGSEVIGLELPIGRPLPGVRVYVLDPLGALVPRGVTGELCIGGEGVATGYLHAPGLTDEKFVPDPYADDVGARLYRTGDLARWNVDGTLQFLGRRDHQTKLRGFRIELGEVEAALASHPAVRAAAALVREDRPGDRKLVAYVVGDATATGEALRAHLASRLPEAMLPAAFVPLEAMPLTINGKIDRRALPAPVATDAHAGLRRAPRDATERTLHTIWTEVLGHGDFGIEESFFAVGGDSLATLPLVFKIHAAFDLELALPEVFATPTIAGLAATIAARRAGDAGGALDLAAKVVLPDDIDPRHATPAIAPRARPRAVLVTGATGFLGAYLLRDLIDRTDAQMLCLVRARDSADGVRRVRANLDGYGLLRDGDVARLVPVIGDLGAPRLGLDAAAFDALAHQADVIFHNGGQVNFLAPYESLAAANVDGTREVLRLATRGHVKPVHVVSTLGVCLTASNLERTVREDDPPPRADEQGGGYNESKWVAEQLALVARDRGLPVTLHRPARITGDSRTGAGNVGDYFSAWILGCVQLGLAPALPDECFDMAPVDYVGPAIARIALGDDDARGNYHYYNARRLPIPQAVATMQEAGLDVREVPYPEWRAALLKAVAAGEDNALAAFAAQFPLVPDAREPRFDCGATERAAAAHGLACPPADRALFLRYLRFLQARGALPKPLEVSA